MEKRGRIMSQASIEIVKEFFVIHNFFVLQKDDILLVQNAGVDEPEEMDKFILSGSEVSRVVKNGVVKPVCWHTMKFTPVVLSRFSEIFEFSKGGYTLESKKFFQGENFKKVLIIPSLPASDKLQKESIKIMKEKGIDYLITFPSIIANLIERIDARNVYLSSVNEILRVLKFYKFFSEKEQKLPF
ncbi:MAG: hypothetical protein NC832_01670 [Candidatus Omnitrophica bacterium]|nr:hypothetical protein [Candidatus Omnitrophota bacterium]